MQQLLCKPADTSSSTALPRLTLISHALCPYVQRAAIVLAEKGAPFQRRDVDLANKPDWFNAVSPLGKTPVLLVDSTTAVFESGVICEYLDETLAPRLHPADALARARSRSWIEFGSALLNNIAAFYAAPDATALAARQRELSGRLLQVESALGSGPYFAGAAFGLVDAAFAPVFRYFDAFEEIDNFAFFDGLPRLHAWRCTLAERKSVRGAVGPDYPQQLMHFLRQRGSALSARMQ